MFVYDGIARTVNVRAVFRFDSEPRAAILLSGVDPSPCVWLVLIRFETTCQRKCHHWDILVQRFCLRSHTCSWLDWYSSHAAAFPSSNPTDLSQIINCLTFTFTHFRFHSTLFHVLSLSGGFHLTDVHFSVFTWSLQPFANQRKVSCLKTTPLSQLFLKIPLLDINGRCKISFKS